MSRATLVALLLSLAMLVVARPARADSPPNAPLWDSSWPTFRPIEYVTTGVAGAASLAAFVGLPTASRAQWSGGVLFDDAARDAFRLRTPGARDTVRTLSDVGMVSSIVLVVAVDSIVVPLARGGSDAAWQLTMMDAESFAWSTLVTTTLSRGTARGRPSYEDCQRNPSFDPLCASGSTASFPSGHANVAFTSAGLSCAHHAFLHLFGDPLADGLACAGMLTLATATASLRVMGDRHYVSDVLVGGALGFGFGFAAPAFLHYSVPRHRADGAFVLTPMGGPSEAGIVAAGRF